MTNLSCFAALAVTALAVGTAATPTASPAESVTFDRDVRAVMKEHCTVCHRGARAAEGLDLSSYAGIMAGSTSGDVVVSGNPDDSLLLLVMTHEEEPAMPPSGEKIPDADLAIIRDWISQGMLESPNSKPVPNTALPQPEEAAPSMPETESKVPGGPALVGARPYAAASLAVSEQAGLLAVASHLQVHLYDLSTMQLTRVLAFPEGEAKVVRFSPSGDRLLAAGGVPSQSGQAVLWDTNTGDRIAIYGDEYDAVLAADLSPDGEQIVIGGTDRLVKVFDVRTGQLIHTHEKHTDWVLSASFSPEGLLLATADRAGNTYIWERHSGEVLHSLRGHKGAVRAVGWGATDNEFVTVCDDGQVRTWRMDTGKITKAWTAHSGGVLALQGAADGTLRTAGRDNLLKAWTWQGKPMGDPSTCRSVPLAVAGSLNGKLFASTLREGLVAASSSQRSLVELKPLQGQTTNQVALLVEAPKPRLIFNRLSSEQLASASPSANTSPKQSSPNMGNELSGRADAPSNRDRLVASAIEELEQSLAATQRRLEELRAAIAAEQQARKRLQDAVAEVDESTARTDDLLEQLPSIAPGLARDPLTSTNDD